MTLDNRKITKELTNKIKTTSIKNSAASLSACTLCPRNCKADRNSGKTGFCGVDSTIYLARAALHMWEEPCISGKKRFRCGFLLRMWTSVLFLPES